MIIVNNPTGLPQWTTATRPVSPANGTQGFNRTRNRAEYYANSFWIDGYFGLNAGLAFTIASLGTIAVGNNPIGVAYSPSNDRIYVANSGSNNVSVIDSTNTVVATIAVGNSPIGVAYSPSNNRIYVTNYTSNNVSVIDPTNTVVATIAVGNIPQGVAYSPSNDRIYVANYTSNNVSILS